MASYPMFTYWLKNEKTREEKRIVSSEYLGDIGEKNADDWVIEDWTVEELDFC